MFFFPNKCFFLSNTEERAQVSEGRVAELELQLKEALEKLRKFEKNIDVDSHQFLNEAENAKESMK